MKRLCPLILILAACSVKSPPPPHVETAVQLPTRASSLVVPVSGSLSQLRSALNAAVPTRVYSIDEDRDACIPKQTAKVCMLPHPAISLFGHKVQDASCGQWVETDVSPAIDCHLTGAVDRGDIQLSANGSTLNVSVPLSASVTARGRGEIGKNIQTTVSGSMVLSAKIAADISPDWTPQLTLDPSYTWTTPPNFHILGIDVTIQDKIDPEIHQALGQLQSTLAERIQDLQLRQSAEALWKKAYEPVRVSSNPDIWVRFTPKAIGLSGISSDDQALTITLMAAGTTETFVGPKPAPGPVTPLPPLSKELPEDGFAFYLPIYADYSAATSVLKQLLEVGKAQLLDVPKLGSTQVTFTDVTLYPTTGGAIALGVSLRAKPPQQWLTTSGKLWVTGKMKVDNAAQKLEVDGLDYGAATDNSAANLLVSIAKLDVIKSKIEAALTYDFSKQYASALQRANAALNQSLPDGVTLSGAITHALVDQIAATPHGIYMGMDVLGNVRVQATPTLVAQK
jgi:hypothetical protein